LADAVALDHWSGEGVDLGQVLGAISALRDQSSERRSARTAVMTLVAIAPGDEQAYRAATALRTLGGHHPARIVVLRPYPDQVADLDARATLHALDLDGHRVVFEEITLMVRGQAAHHLDTLVEAFTLADLPVAVWYVDSVPQPGDPLLDVATAVLLDSRDAGDDLRMRALIDLTRRRTVVDLSWIRLGPWRELLAGLFEPPANRSWLPRIESGEVTGKVGPRRLLGGWLCAQLRLRPDALRLSDARHVEIRLRAPGEEGTNLFVVERADARRTVAARASGPGVVELSLSTALAEEPLPTALSTALTHLDPDPVWERALATAALLPVGDVPGTA
jgi:glucose-6-phosphate dehydrogenase assembly protein OpcA